LVNVFGEKLSTIGTFEDVFKYKNWYSLWNSVRNCHCFLRNKQFCFFLQFQLNRLVKFLVNMFFLPITTLVTGNSKMNRIQYPSSTGRKSKAVDW
jgi:hypothetical protein